MRYIAIDQYGHLYRIKRYPRKELLDHFARTNASNIYSDSDTGVRHIGYEIAGFWLIVYGVEGHTFATKVGESYG